MGNTRTFKAGRRAATQTLREQLREQNMRLGYQQGLIASLQAQLTASKMERPEDIEAWIESLGEEV